MNRKVKKLILIALALTIISGVTNNTIIAKAETISKIEVKDAQAKNPIKACDNYIIYYGNKFNVTILEKLKTYNMVVINPLEVGANDARKKLQAAGVKVYAYTSSIEIPTYDTELVKSIEDGEKLKVDGKILIHWETNQLGDLRQATYRAKVINKVTERIANVGYDGVFVDTLDDLENMSDILEENKVKVTDKDAYIEEMEQAGVTFLEELKNANPNLSIIQNRAFQLLDQGSNKLVDAVLYEDICKSADIEYYNAIKAVLDRYTSNNNGVVMALANQKKYYAESKKIAQDNRWLYYQTTDYASTSIVNGGNYKIDIDWVNS